MQRPRHIGIEPMSWPAALLWAIVIPTALSNGPAPLYMLSIVGAFGSLQMLPGDGGATLLPQTVYAAVLIAKVALQRGNVMRGLEAALDPRRLGLFTAFTIYAILTALLLPRLFAGLVEVIPASGTADLEGGAVLMPRSGNITQTCYLVISYLTAVAFAVIGSRSDVRYHYMQALVWGAFALILTGFLDLACYRAGLSSLLDPFRTVQYTLLTEVEEEGIKRVVGLTPEASTYGILCVDAATAILFLRPLYPAGAHRLIATLALFLLLVMAVLSTSTTAVVGGGVLGCVYIIDIVRRYLTRNTPTRSSLGWEIGVLAGVTMAAVVVFFLLPERNAQVFEFLDRTLFQKTTTSSYYQRSLWTQIGWQAFVDSGGLGVGFGSIRTSNWAVSVLGSTGIFGGLLIFGFLGQKFVALTRGQSAGEASFALAMKLALLPAIAMSLVAGGSPAIGIGMATIVGFLSCEGTTLRIKDPDASVLREATQATSA